MLRDWEIWVADLLESHLSYPTLAFFRSQHENQSWISALALILDLSAYVLACGQTGAARQAGFTFAIGRHAVGDLSNVFFVQPRTPTRDRLDAAAAQRLTEVAMAGGLLSQKQSDAGQRLTAIRASYEPYLEALSELLLMDLPPWVPATGATDNWESTAWDFESPAAQFGPGSPFSGR